MKKTMKVLTILLLAIILITITTNAFAVGGELKPSSVSATFADDDGGLSAKAGKIVGMLRNIAIVASVVIVTILGIKYMLGSVEEKAEYKKSFMPLIVGMVVVVSATSIASFIFNMAK